MSSRAVSASEHTEITLSHSGYGVGVSNRVQPHPGGGFNPPEPTTKGGPDYGRFVAAVRELQDHARAVDAPDDVITEAANLLEKAASLLAPFDADEWASPSGRRVDLPNRGNVLSVPMELNRVGDDRVGGWVRFPRFYLGRNGAAHGGAIGLLFDSVLGFTAAVLTGERTQRTAYLHIDYRAIVPIGKTLTVDGELTGVEGRKISVRATVYDGIHDDAHVLTEAHALFVKLNPGQP